MAFMFINLVMAQMVCISGNRLFSKKTEKQKRRDFNFHGVLNHLTSTFNLLLGLKVVLSLDLEEILWSQLSNQTSSAVFSHGTISVVDDLWFDHSNETFS